MNLLYAGKLSYLCASILTNSMPSLATSRAVSRLPATISFLTNAFLKATTSVTSFLDPIIALAKSCPRGLDMRASAICSRFISVNACSILNESLILAALRAFLVIEILSSRALPLASGFAIRTKARAKSSPPVTLAILPRKNFLIPVLFVPFIRTTSPIS